VIPDTGRGKGPVMEEEIWGAACLVEEEVGDQMKVEMICR